MSVYHNTDVDKSVIVHVNVYLQAAQSDDDRAERLLKTLEQCESELVDFYTALVAAGQRDVVNLLRRNELLFSSFNG